MATRSEFAASIKAKYPQYAGVDDSILVDKILEKHPEYADRVDPAEEAPIANPNNTKPEISSARDNVTFLGSEKLGKIAADMFPRVARGAVEGRGMGQQAIAGLNDAASLFGRGIASSGIAPSGASMKDGNPGLGEIKGSSIGGNIIRDPGVSASIAAAPFTGGISLAGVGGVAARSAVTGAASVAAHQGENVLEGKGFQPGQAAGEEALNIAIPVVGNKLAPFVKGAGVKVYNSIVKPSKAAIKGGYDTEKFLETGLGGGGLVHAQESVENKINDLADQIEEIITGKSRQQTVTTKAEAFSGPEEKTGIDVTGSVVPEPKPADLPNGEAPKQIGPSVIPMGAPKPKSTPPEVAITPNENPMSPRIDPRFVKPTATSTPNQPPIPDAPPGASYGPPSNRDLPALVNRPGSIQAPQVGGPPVGPGLNEIPGQSAASAAQRGPLGLPPGAPENIIDVSKKVNLLEALNSTRRGMAQELSSGHHAGLAEDIGSGQQQWLTDLEGRGMAGEVTPKSALTYQRGVGAMGKFDNGQNPQLIPPKARVANQLYGQIGDRLEEVAPEIGPLRKEISSLIPARLALTDAAARTDKNFAVGLREAMAAAGALHGVSVNGPAGALPGLGLAGSIRAASSPRVGNALFNAGKSMAQPSALRDAIKRMLLETIYAPGDSQSP